MRTIKILGRNLPIAILAILISGAVVSAGAIIYFTIRGRVDVTYRTPVIAEPSSYWVDMAQGEVAYQDITIINRSDSDKTVKLVTDIRTTDGAPADDRLTVTYYENWIILSENELTVPAESEVSVEVAIKANWDDDLTPSDDIRSYAVKTDIEVKAAWIESTFYTSENAGDVWFVPLTGTISAESYSDEIHVNNGDQRLGAFTLEITYDPNIIVPTEAVGIDWTADIIPNFDNAENGLFTVGGFTATAPVQGNDVPLLTITWNCVGTGPTDLSIDVITLGDYDTGENVGTPNGIDGERTIVE